MTGLIYFLTPPTVAGGPCGNGVTPDGTIPVGAVVCTQAQAQNLNDWTIVDNTIVAVTPPTPTLQQQALAALSAGVTISLSGSITLPPTVFPCDPTTTTKIATVLNIYNASGSFPPNASPTCGMKTASAQDTWVTFTGPQYAAVVFAIANYVFVLNEIIDNNPAYTTLPNPVIPTITV